jgi:membrane protein
MRPRVDSTVSLLRAVLEEGRAESVTLLAGSLAYLSFVSLVPALALSFLALAVVGDETLAATLLAFTDSVLPPRPQALLREYVVVDATETASASLVGVGMLLWGSLKAFRGLDAAFSRIYRTTGDNTLSNQVGDALVVAAGLALALASVAAVTTVLSTVPLVAVRLLGPAVLVVGLSLAFLPIYYRFPDVSLSVRDAVPGVAVAAVGWLVLQQTFQLYVVVTGRANAADVVGAVLLLLTWLYFGSLLLLVGAVLNAVLGGYRADGDASPSEGFVGESVLYGRQRLQRRRNARLIRGGPTVRSDTARSAAGSARAPETPLSHAAARRRRRRRVDRQARWYRRSILTCSPARHRLPTLRDR